MDMLAIMADADPYGALTVGGRPLAVAQLARMAGASADETQQLLDELLEAGVCSREADGMVVCRRMVRERCQREQVLARVRKNRSKNGCNARVTPDAVTRQNANHEDVNECFDGVGDACNADVTPLKQAPNALHERYQKAPNDGLDGGGAVKTQKGEKSAFSAEKCNAGVTLSGSHCASITCEEKQPVFEACNAEVTVENHSCNAAVTAVKRESNAVEAKKLRYNNTPIVPLKGDGGNGENHGVDAESDLSLQAVEVGSEVQGGHKVGLMVGDPVALRVAACLGRRPTTRWTAKEVRAYRRLLPLEMADLQLVEAYYAATIAPEEDIRRRDVAQLLNNWAGEVDRARRWLERQECEQKRLTWRM